MPKTKRKKNPDRKFPANTLDCKLCARLECNLEGKVYCGECSKDSFKECKTCSLVYKSKESFCLDSAKCNLCFKKFLKRQQSGKRKKKTQDISVVHSH